MSFDLMPLGRPGEHKGVSHALKHYLNPAELWDDVAQSIAEENVPSMALNSPPLEGRDCSKFIGPASSILAPDWPHLERLCASGYFEIVREYARTGIESQRTFQKDTTTVLLLHLGDGILLEAYLPKRQMRSAYRDPGVTLSSPRAYWLLRRDEDALRRRLTQARTRAERRFTSFARYETSDE